MSTTDPQNIPSSVPNFMDGDETEGGVATQPGAVEQPENSAEQRKELPEGEPIGAVSDSISNKKAADFNPVLDGDDEEYEGEVTVPAPRKPRASIATPVAQPPVSAPEQTILAAEEAVEAVEPDAEPTAKKRKRKVNPAAPKYGRSALRAADYLLMALVRKCGFSTSRQIGVALNVATSTAHKRALGLKEIGLIGSDKVFGMTQLWYLTQKGYEVLDFMGITDHRVSKRYHAGKGVPSKLEHTLAVNHVIAQLVGGTSELLKLAPVELSSGIDLLPFLVPESYMNSEYSKATYDKKGNFKPIELARDLRRRVTDQVRNGDLHPSEVLANHPALWTVVNLEVHQKTTKESHPADLVIDLEHLRTDLKAATSIGVEVELSPKQGPELKKILNSVWQNKTDSDFSSLALLAYLTPSEMIGKAVRRAAKEVAGEENTARVARVSDLKDAAGNRFDGRAWTL